MAKAQSRKTNSLGNGINVLAADSSYFMEMAFRFQTLYVGSTDLTFSNWEESLMIRRSRLKFGGWVLNPNISYKLELGLSNRDTRGTNSNENGYTANIILDAVTMWRFALNWELWVGQTKLPGNRERVVSSQNLQFVDRNLVNFGFTLDRDIGVQLYHYSTFGSIIINQAVAISGGEGRNIINNNFAHGREYTARIEILPFGQFTKGGDYLGSDLFREKRPKLSIGITGDYNADAIRARGNLGDFQTDTTTNSYFSDDLATLFVDGVFKYKGWSATSEYAYRTSRSKVAGFGYGMGIMGSVAYLNKKNFEVGVRYAQIEPLSNTSSITEQHEYLLGFSKYIHCHDLKIQSDISYTQEEGRRDYYTFRLQMEVAL